MKLTIHDGDTILIDNSSLEHVQNCPREGEYALIEGQVLDETKAALQFGEAIHLAQRLRYFLCGTAPASAEVEGRQMMLLEKFWEKKPTPMGDHRTLGLCQSVIQKYNAHYGAEDFQLFTSTASPTFTVEEPFAMPLGTVLGKYKIVWTGRIDLPIRDGRGNWVLDHKHTSLGGEYVLEEFYMSGQFMGYCKAFQDRFKQKVEGACVNLLTVRKPAKTEKAKKPQVEFLRRYIAYDQDRLDEWQHNTLRIVSTFLQHKEDKYFPMHTKNCVRKYGKCGYFGVCTMSPAARRATLFGPEYKEDLWSPIHSDDEIFNWVIKLPVDQITYNLQPILATEDATGPSITDILSIT